MTEGSGGARGFLRAVRVGDVVEGVVASVGRSVRVTLDGFLARPLGEIGPLDTPWGQSRETAFAVGRRISALVTAVDRDEERVGLSPADTAHPDLWAFLSGLRPGRSLTGTVASIERYGVFVALDEGPDHPVFPGVGFITYPELSWNRFESASEVVRVGQRVTCAFLQFDTWNGEARLSLRATLPDPFLAFADAFDAAGGEGREVTYRGQVTKVTPIGVFVRVADGVEGLVPVEGVKVSGRSEAADEGGGIVGDQVDVVVARVVREGRRVVLAWVGAAAGSGR
ncbi:S1 RNA-binding domain-containing protein [Streptomyces sp. Amel2xC10]|uniref:S1 RNA-binding domain-containing protein n=1 Tax=Streptomyces sp. Amel2xC10 TaxID=1305826 RepID=UPI002119F976|nr:S1 RNA-binding domain-containing protein [Streptomyces sp. Amel2xC10]